MAGLTDRQEHQECQRQPRIDDSDQNRDRNRDPDRDPKLQRVSGHHQRRNNANDKPHDGAVAVDETRLAGARAHLVLPVSHTSMVCSRDVAREVSLSGASAELRVMDGPAPPGTAVITDFAS